jgi:hypothetical protein
MSAQSSLTKSLELIGKDIVQVLKDNNNVPMCLDELFENRKLMNYSSYGWSFTIEHLIRIGKIEECPDVNEFGDILYKLK